MKIRKSDLYVLLIVLFPICALAEGYLSYYDEVIAIIGITSLLLQLTNKRTTKEVNIIAGLLTVITVIGLISNINSRLISNPFPIFVDLLSLWKPFACLWLFRKVCLDTRKCAYIVRRLSSLAKVTIYFVFITALVQQFVDIGAAGLNNTSYLGLKQFGFFWNNSIVTGWLLFGCLLVLAANNEKHLVRYFVISIVPMLLTFSSLVYCWIIVAVFMYVILKRDEVFKIRYIIIIAIAVSLFTLADITKYFLDVNSPRMLFIQYGIKTANTYFPVGSGFATYGTDMAARYYSPLYQLYGWSNLWTLGTSGKFLNDVFFAGILGQFGWFGFGLYLLCLLQLFKSINTKQLSKEERVLSLATVITISVVMIASGAAKTIMGVFVFAVLGIVSSRTSQTDSR